MPPAHDFLDPRALREHLDAPLLATLPARPAPPVFVLGLHRSGTTWLYQQLAARLHVAPLTLYHVTHYRRLLHARREGLEAAYQADVARVLAERGILDRGIDAIGVGPGSLEEYAFILRKFTPAWGHAPASEALLDELMRKLTALHPEAPALLLKNPFDLASAPAIRRRWPEARFVFIRRDPVRVLNSQFRNHFLYRRGPEPFLSILLAGIPLWKATFALGAAADRLVPDALYQRLAVAFIRRSIAAELRAHYASLPALPPDRWIEVEYEALMADPAPVMARLEAFLGLPARPGAEATAPAPRLEALHPTVAAAADDIRRALSPFPDARLDAEVAGRLRPVGA